MSGARITLAGRSAAREAGRADAKKHAAAWLDLPPRERFVMLHDRALGKSEPEHYYVGLLEGLLSECQRAQALTVPAKKRNPARVEVASWAEDAYEAFHWGLMPDSVIHSEAGHVRSGETLCGLGELVAIAYRTKKGDEKGVWEHEFERPKPLLTYQQSGSLIVCGGGYTITPRGIEG